MSMGYRSLLLSTTGATPIQPMKVVLQDDLVVFQIKIKKAPFSIILFAISFNRI